MRIVANKVWQHRMMIEAFAHEATLEMPDGSDTHAPGGAITRALCGSNDHELPCPLAAHYTGVEVDGTRVRLRILFTTERAAADRVRALIAGALATSACTTAEGDEVSWRLVDDGPSGVHPAERDHAQRLIASTRRG